MTDLWGEAQAEYQKGNLDTSIRHGLEVLRTEPDQVDALHLVGIALHTLGRSREALGPLERAVGLDPGYADLHLHLGIVQHALGEAQASRMRFRKALELDPALWEAHRYLGLLARAAGDRTEARACFQRALRLQPRSEALRIEAGNTDREAGRLDEAVAHFQGALALHPRSAKAAFNLGSTLMDLGRGEDAARAFRQAATVDPGFAAAHACLGSVLLSRGDLAGFRAHWAEARRIGLEDPGLESSWLYGLQFDPVQDAAALLEAHRAWGRALEARIPEGAPSLVAEAAPLRVGYLSPDFRQHSCAHFLEPLFRAHDRNAVRVYAYSLVPRPDAVTARFQHLADAWRDVSSLDAAAIAALARADGLQVLVDLAGHTGGNRIEVFAHRAAPVQLTWLGYPATTGLSRLEGRIVDAWTDPPGAEAHGTEPLLRLPGCFLCYGPPADAPDPAAPPSLDSGTITFGSFNALPKLNDRVIALWSRILREVPRSRLRLKAAGLEEPETRARLQARFADAGLDAHRLDLSGWEPGPAQHLARYQALDLALDPFPYNGTTTTCEALWMGVPVLVLEGGRHAARVGLSLLHAAGLPELACPDEDAYLRAAVDLANDHARLRRYRATLRGQVAAPGLCDAGAFARGMEALYSRLWAGP